MMLPGLMELPLIFMGKPGWSVGKIGAEASKVPGRSKPAPSGSLCNFRVCVSRRQDGAVARGALVEIRIALHGRGVLGQRRLDTHQLCRLQAHAAAEDRKSVV